MRGYPFSFQAKKHLAAEDRKLVCESMCHDVSTADRFYTKVPEIDEVFRVRDLRMQALQSASEGMEGAVFSEVDDTDSEEGTTGSEAMSTGDVALGSGNDSP